MKEDFFNWVTKKAGCWNANGIITLEILIQAMFAINREDKWYIKIDDEHVYCAKNKTMTNKEFFYTEYNNSEIETLEKALEYIWEQEVK